jgi:RNA polymerase sigma-70 factor, ECF subfamily
LGVGPAMMESMEPAPQYETVVPADVRPVDESATGNLRLRTIVTQHVDFVWRSLRRLGVCEADLPDAAQQVYLVVARKLSEVRCGSERGFLFQTALRVAADMRRSRRRRRECEDAPLAEIEDSAPRPDHYAEERRRRAQLDRVLDAMPLELRAVFVLSEIEELPMVEIALLLDIPAGTVASRLRRARLRFREQVALLHETERQRSP